MNFERNLLNLLEKLQNRTWQPSPYSCFAITDPKLREVWASEFRDRIIHHLLVAYLEPIWEKKFIFHSYTCRKDKGAQRAVQDLGKSILHNDYFLQIDIKSYFVSIDKNILYSLIKRQIKHPDIIWLSKKIIFQNPNENCQFKGDTNLLTLIPKHKSLFYANKDKGLPIGNLTSQFFANVYLNELDQFVKHKLKCRNYFRYMDDFLLLHNSQKQLFSWKREIIAFLKNKLLLEPHPTKQVLRPAKQGINFCGYIIKPRNILIRQKTVKKLKNKLWQFNHAVVNSFGTRELSEVCDNLFYDKYSVLPDFTDRLQKIYATVNSTYGFFRHADCFRLRKNLYEKHFNILKIYLKPANENYDYFVWNEPPEARPLKAAKRRE